MDCIERISSGHCRDGVLTQSLVLSRSWKDTSQIGGRPRQLEFAREERISKRESLGDLQQVSFPRQVQKRNEHVCTHRQTSTQMFRLGFFPIAIDWKQLKDKPITSGISIQWNTT